MNSGKDIYQSCIAESILCKLLFDCREWREILEKIVSRELVNQSYIAGGGYLIDYCAASKAAQANKERFRELQKSQTLQLFVNIRKYFSAEDQEKIFTKEIYPLVKRGVGGSEGDFSLTIPRSADQFWSGIKKAPFNFNIKVFITKNDIEKTLDSFTFKPCRIGYDYLSDRFFLSEWFLVGGNMEIAGNWPKAHYDLIERYEYKNITKEIANQPILIDNFINLNHQFVRSEPLFEVHSYGLKNRN